MASTCAACRIFLGTTRRAHASTEVATLAGIPALREVEARALDNLPPEEPASLLHGDLVGQNILLHTTAPPAVIDWEHATPFQVAHDLDRLVDAYTARAVRRTSACDVRLHELWIVGRW